MAGDGRAQIAGSAVLLEIELHPAKRWGEVVGAVVKTTHDLATVRAWAREVGICETQLRVRCRRAGVTAKASLDFVRLLRAVVCREARGGSLQDYLDIGEARTMTRLLKRVGLDETDELTVFNT